MTILFVVKYDSESPHPYDHFDTKIEVVTMKHVIAKSYPTQNPEVCSSQWRASYPDLSHNTDLIN